MNLDLSLTTAPIPHPAWDPGECGDSGAVAEFYGIVRADENGRRIAGLHYEAYSVMAIAEMERILRELEPKHPCHAVRIIHRHGPVAVGETAIFVGVRAAHRGEAFGMLRDFMDRLKVDVPIWKSGVFDNPIRPPTPEPGSVDAVLDQVDAACHPRPPQRIALGDADGLVLAQAYRADADQPAFDRSAVDGFVVLEGTPAGTYLVVGEIQPGEASPASMPPNTARRIFTGAEVPIGCGLVMSEDATVDAGGYVTLRCAATTHGIRRRGSSVNKGSIILDAGRPIGPGEAALLASAGITEPLVFPRVRVFHVTTGREVVPADLEPEHGQVRNTNGPLIRSMVERAGGAVLPSVHVDESVEALVAAVSAAGAFDLLLVSGGSSVGCYDRTPQALEAMGFAILSRRVNAKPGKPLLIARRGSQLAFGLPGNPVSHFATFQIFVRRALDRLSGSVPREWLLMVLGEGAQIRRDPRETFWPGRVRVSAGRLFVHPLPWLDSGDLTALAGVDGLIRIPAGSEPPALGSLVSVSVVFGSAGFSGAENAGRFEA